MRPRTLRAVSLFSNCGAGDLGYAQAGFQFDVMAELDPRRLEVCLLNHRGAVGVPGDLRETWPSVVATYRKRAGAVRPALLAACPPCQGMSSARSDRGNAEDADAGSRDKRNLLVTVIANVATALQPDFVVVENVQAFLTRKIRHPDTQEAISAARLLIADLKENYEVFPVAVNLCDFGVPQTRKRTFLTFIRRDLRGLGSLLASQTTPFPIPTHAKDYGGKAITLRQALSHFALPSLDARSSETASSSNKLHCVPIWQDRRYPMVAAIPRHTGKSAWQNQACEACGRVSVGNHAVLCPRCGSPLLRPVVKNPHGQYRFIKGFKSSYSRMKSDLPAATITTASGHIGSDHTIHPYENRLLSALECARLQTFPKTFKWGAAVDKWGLTNVRSMIGEAVPPLFTRKHGKILLRILANRTGSSMMSFGDVRIRSARKKLGLLSKRINHAKAMV